MEKDRAPVPARQQRQLLGDIRALIDAAKADYGKEIFQTLSGKLVAQYGRGFEKSKSRST